MAMHRKNSVKVLSAAALILGFTGCGANQFQQQGSNPASLASSASSPQEANTSLTLAPPATKEQAEAAVDNSHTPSLKNLISSVSSTPLSSIDSDHETKPVYYGDQFGSAGPIGRTPGAAGTSAVSGDTIIDSAASLVTDINSHKSEFQTLSVSMKAQAKADCQLGVNSLQSLNLSNLGETEQELVQANLSVFLALGAALQ